MSPCVLTGSICLFALGAAAFSDEPLPGVIEFNRDIRPIFADTCYACHGPDKNKRKVELRLDREASVFRNRKDVRKLTHPTPSWYTRGR